MNPKFTGTCMGVIVAGMFITGLLVRSHLPGTPTTLLVFGLPIIVTLIWGLWALFPQIDPIAKGFPGFRYIYDFFWVLLTAVLAYVYALTLGEKLGIVTDRLALVVPAVSLLLVITGALLPRVKRNWFFGVRTPWTLQSDAVWDQTHRFASPLIVLAGLVSLFALIDPTRTVVLSFVFGPLLFVTLISVVYSYFLYRREA